MKVLRVIAPHRAPWVSHDPEKCHVCYVWFKRHPDWVPEERPEGREWRFSDDFIGCHVWEETATQ